jgi:hypothetical protein
MGFRVIINGRSGMAAASFEPDVAEHEAAFWIEQGLRTHPEEAAALVNSAGSFGGRGTPQGPGGGDLSKGVNLHWTADATPNDGIGARTDGPNVLSGGKAGGAGSGKGGGPSGAGGGTDHGEPGPQGGSGHEGHGSIIEPEKKKTSDGG